MRSASGPITASWSLYTYVNVHWGDSEHPTFEQLRGRRSFIVLKITRVSHANVEW